jgi:hypothetical protein
MDDPQQVGIGDAMLQKTHQVGMREMVEEAFDIGLHDPLRLPVGDDLRDPPQRIVRTAPRTEAVRAVAKLRLPDGLQNSAQAVLNQAILKTRNP